jgi:hypothetical protein
MQTRDRERREFLRRLRREPGFLSRHAGALSAAVGGKLFNKIRRAVAGAQRGPKRWPKWLERRSLPGAPGGGTRAFALPPYPRPVQRTRSAQAGRAEWQRAPDLPDPEDYLADNRWGFLLEGLLAEQTDWQAGLDRCRQWIAAHTDKSDPVWEAYSTCERVANVLVFLALIPAPQRTAAAADGLYGFVDESLQWIYRHLEYYGPTRTNNHILNNARALAMGGAATANATAVDAAIRTLRQSLPQLIGANGFLRERSSHYQVVIVNWLLDAWRFVAAHRG